MIDLPEQDHRVVLLQMLVVILLRMMLFKVEKVVLKTSLSTP